MRETKGIGVYIYIYILTVPPTPRSVTSESWEHLEVTRLEFGAYARRSDDLVFPRFSLGL